MSVFFTSDYRTAFGFRSLLTIASFVNAFQLSRMAGRSLLMTLIDFAFFVLVNESICYYINNEKVKLFLQKEKSSSQESQF